MEYKSIMLKNGTKIITLKNDDKVKSFVDIDGKDKFYYAGTYYELSFTQGLLKESIHQPMLKLMDEFEAFLGG